MLNPGFALVKLIILFRLEQYSWRSHEQRLNDSVPQFRAAITLAASEIPLRIHFIHMRSRHAHAVPLLLIPPFPFSNFSVHQTIEQLANPDEPENNQPFHVIIPSLPGIGFSDALPDNTVAIPAIAYMLDVLMARLDYHHYIASNTGPAASSPGMLDWKLAKYLIQNYQRSCIAFHVINPYLTPPSFRKQPLLYLKWRFAKFVNRPVFGYTVEDLRILRTSAPHAQNLSLLGTNIIDPEALDHQTLGYALCDSPTGMLSLMMTLMRLLDVKVKLPDSDLITITQLAWLPGPEAMLRLCSHCAGWEPERRSEHGAQKPRIGITTFTGQRMPNEKKGNDDMLLPISRLTSNTCDVWAEPDFRVLSSSKVSGVPGFLLWERPQVIAEGVRKLFGALDKAEKKLLVPKKNIGSELEGIIIQEDVPAMAGPSSL